MLNDKCPFCNKSENILVYSFPTSKVEKCKECGLIYTILNPSYDSSKGNDDCYNEEVWGDIYKKLENKLRLRHVNSISTVKKYVKSGNLLDVGCNTGFFLSVAKENGFAVHGVEPVQSAADFAASNVGATVVSGFLQDAEYPDQSFDVITLFDVLEHVPEPQSILSELKRILKDEGVIVIQCPNIESSMAKSCGKYWRWLLTPQHLYHFSIKSLSAFLNNSGWDVVEVKTFDDYDEYADNLWEAFVRKKFQEGVLSRYLLKATRFARPYIKTMLKARPASDTSGALMFFIAKKRIVA